MDGRFEVIRYTKTEYGEWIRLKYIIRGREYIIELDDRILVIEYRIPTKNFIYEHEERIVFPYKNRYLTDIINELKENGDIETFYYLLKELKENIQKHLEIRRDKVNNKLLKEVTMEDEIEKEIKDILALSQQVAIILRIKENKQ